MRVEARSCSVKSELLRKGMWLDNDGVRQTPLLRGLDCFRVFTFAGGGRRIKFRSLVGEKLKLPRVGCLEACRRRHTAVFLLSCWCLGVDVVGFLFWHCVARLRELELLVRYVELGNNNFGWSLYVRLPLYRLLVHPV
jgi:hypothetical protein